MAVKLPSKSTDVNYVCQCSDGKSITVNPSHLSHFSGYFSSLLHSEMKETRTKSLSLKLIHSDILQLVVTLLPKCQSRREEGIEYLKENELATNTNSLTQLLDAADYLDIPMLREVCDEHICRTRQVTTANFEELLSLNHRYSLTRLGQVLVNFMSLHISDLSSTEGWLTHLSSSLLEDLLASDNTKVLSEWELVKLVEQWLQCQQKKTSSTSDVSKHLKSILRHIRVTEIVRDKEEDSVPEGLRQEITSYIAEQIVLYQHDPKSYRMTHHEQSNIRRPVDVIVSLGTHDSIPSMFFCLPVSYASLTEDDSGGVVRPTFKHKVHFSELKHSSFPLPVLCLREFSACSLNNILYIAGGQNSFSETSEDALSYVFELDLADLRWTEVCRMQEPRCLFHLGALNGNLYAVGGANNTGELSSVERYDPYQDRWTYQAHLPYNIHEHAGCTHGGSLYISGGHTGTGHTSAVSCFRPKFGEWVECAPLRTARAYHTMASFKNHLYVIGGCTLSNGRAVCEQSLEIYNIAQDQWTVLETKYPSQFSAALTSFPADNTIQCFGGYNFRNRHFSTEACIFFVEKGEWQIVPFHFADTRMREVVMTQVKIREKTVTRYFFSCERE